MSGARIRFLAIPKCGIQWSFLVWRALVGDAGRLRYTESNCSRASADYQRAVYDTRRPDSRPIRRDRRHGRGVPRALFHVVRSCQSRADARVGPALSRSRSGRYLSAGGGLPGAVSRRRPLRRCSAGAHRAHGGVTRQGGVRLPGAGTRGVACAARLRADYACVHHEPGPRHALAANAPALAGMRQVDCMPEFVPFT